MRPKFTREDLREIRSAARALRGERVLWGDGGSEDVILSTGPAEVHVFPDKRGKALTASVFRGRAANAERVTIDPVASGAKRPAGRKTATRRKVARRTPNPQRPRSGAFDAVRRGSGYVVTNGSTEFSNVVTRSEALRRARRLNEVAWHNEAMDTNRGGFTSRELWDRLTPQQRARFRASSAAKMTRNPAPKRKRAPARRR